MKKMGNHFADRIPQTIIKKEPRDFSRGSGGSEK